MSMLVVSVAWVFKGLFVVGFAGGLVIVVCSLSLVWEGVFGEEGFLLFLLFGDRLRRRFLTSVKP